MKRIIIITVIIIMSAHVSELHVPASAESITSSIIRNAVGTGAAGGTEFTESVNTEVAPVNTEAVSDRMDVPALAELPLRVEAVVEPSHLAVDAFSNLGEGLIRCYTFEDVKLGIFVVNRWGSVVVPSGTYDDITVYKEGIARVKKNGKFGYIDKKGNVAVPTIYDAASDFLDGCAAVKVGEKWGFIDKTGTVKLPFEYFTAWSAGGGMLAVMKDGLWAFANTNGKFITGFTYLDFGQFENGAIAVLSEDGWHYITNMGETTKQPLPSPDTTDTPALIVVCENGNYGVGFDNISLIPCEYSQVEVYPDVGLIVVERGGKLGIFHIFDVAIPVKARIRFAADEIELSCYMFKGSNYLKLRDIAYLLRESSKKFDILWDDSTHAITILKSEDYVEVGGEWADNDAQAKDAAATNQLVYNNGTAWEFRAYNVDGNTYFRLRDLTQMLDLNLEWDDENKIILLKVDE